MSRPDQADGLQAAVLYVPPYEVSVLELGKIGRHFDSDRPFFGLQPAGPVAGEPVHDTVPEMAEHYVDAIKSLQPHGPYLIGGHCDGSWVAHETARQLSDHGDEVGYIAMVDPAPPPDEFTTSRGTRRILDRLRYYARDGRLIPAIRRQVKLRLDKLLVLRFGSAASRRVRSVRIAHEAAFDRYRFVHDHRSPVHLVRSTELAVLMDEISWYEDLGGRDGHVDVTDISSTHARLPKEPETVELADVIGRQIDLAEVRNEASASHRGVDLEHGP